MTLRKIASASFSAGGVYFEGSSALASRTDPASDARGGRHDRARAAGERHALLPLGLRARQLRERGEQVRDREAPVGVAGLFVNFSQSDHIGVTNLGLGLADSARRVLGGVLFGVLLPVQSPRFGVGQGLRRHVFRLLAVRGEACLLAARRRPRRDRRGLGLAVARLVVVVEHAAPHARRPRRPRRPVLGRRLRRLLRRRHDGLVGFRYVGPERVAERDRLRQLLERDRRRLGRDRRRRGHRRRCGHRRAAAATGAAATGIGAAGGATYTVVGGGAAATGGET